MTISPTFFIRGYHIAHEGATLLASLWPGANPDEVVAAFSMIGMGDDARMWRALIIRAELASKALADQADRVIPTGASLLDALLAGNMPEMRALSDDVALQRKLAADAWCLLGLVIDEVRAEIPGFDH